MTAERDSDCELPWTVLAGIGFCTSGDELSSAKGLVGGVLTYNRSVEYGRAVFARAGTYGTGSRAI